MEQACRTRKRAARRAWSISGYHSLAKWRSARASVRTASGARFSLPISVGVGVLRTQKKARLFGVSSNFDAHDRTGGKPTPRTGEPVQTFPRTANKLQIADNHRMGMRKTSRTPIEREACENEKGILPIWHFCRENHRGGFAAPIPFSRIRRLFATAPTSRIKAAEHRSLILLKPRRRGILRRR